MIVCFYFKSIDLAMGLRLSQEEEEMGADIIDHGINNVNHGTGNKQEIYRSLRKMVNTNTDNSQIFKETIDRVFFDMARSCEQ